MQKFKILRQPFQEEQWWGKRKEREKVNDYSGTIVSERRQWCTHTLGPETEKGTRQPYPFPVYDLHGQAAFWTGHEGGQSYQAARLTHGTAFGRPTSSKFWWAKQWFYRNAHLNLLVANMKIKTIWLRLCCFLIRFTPRYDVKGNVCNVFHSISRHLVSFSKLE